MRLVFLDFDGVLNCETTRENNPHGNTGIERRLVERLNTLCRRTGADIVVSSAWRRYFAVDELRTMLQAHGLSPAVKILGATPNLFYEPRGMEIDAWLKKHGHEVRSFVILDDHGDMAHHYARLVQTNPAVGLRDRDIEAAQRLLIKGRAA